MSPSFVLEVKDLVKDYSSGFWGKRVRVLKGVTFNVERGEIFGFVGPNGAGKTTTFKSILGFVRVTSGEIRINGKPNIDTSVKSVIGYLPESPYFYDYLTGEELLRYMASLHSIDKDIAERRIEELLEKVNMTHARKLQLRKYSKGMLQRIGIAQSLVNDPQFLILDEPMSGLDPMGRHEMMELILEEKRKGKTILLSSHILSDIESMCDRVGVILNGSIVKVGVLSDLFRDIPTDYEMIVNESVESVERVMKGRGVEVYQRAGFAILRFDEERKKEIVRSILESGFDILSIYPLRKSLEGLFVGGSGTTTKNSDF